VDPMDLSAVERAAELSKADLVTGMVCEFTELQGVMGREYALLSGETQATADAIFEHYLPRFAGDILPRTSAGRAVAVADKLDNIITTFSRGLIPTGSQDPYALRRQALGIVNILIDGKVFLSLTTMACEAMKLAGITEVEKQRHLSASLEEFFRLRFKNVLADAGIRYDIIDAVLATDTDDIYDACLRAEAMASPEGTAAMERGVEAFTRAANIAGQSECDAIDESLFEVMVETALYQAYLNARARIDVTTTVHDYVGALQVVAELSAPINDFFTEVMVMVDNVKVRENRLSLLRRISALTLRIADFRRIVSQ
jgi:glycyl-tRNA synthetase beta chain